MQAEVTIVMVPRERYSAILTTIESIYENTTDIPFKLIVIEGALPENIYTRIKNLAQQRNFQFVHKDYPLNPNEARNIGLQFVDTDYVVFSDNDIIFTPTWLSTLVNTAKEYQAWLVGPTILDGEPTDGFIHATAGISGFENKEGKRYYHFVPGNVHKYMKDVAHTLERGPTTMLEFHVILCAMHIFEKIGPLDEKVSSFGDHDDLVMSVQKAGGPTIYEPNSVVGYHDPGTNISVVEKTDLPFYLLRWSDEWNFGSVDRAAEKWGLADDDRWMPHAKHWSQIRRRKAYFLAGLPGKFVGFVIYRISEKLGIYLEDLFCKAYTKELRKRREIHFSN